MISLHKTHIKAISDALIDGLFLSFEGYNLWFECVRCTALHNLLIYWQMWLFLRNSS